ncbi:unnamed protein product, partial [Polarella glacialis]
VLRGFLVVIGDVRALVHDQSFVPPFSWVVQCVALLGTNVMNLLILKIVMGALKRRAASQDEANSTQAIPLLQRDKDLAARAGAEALTATLNGPISAEGITALSPMTGPSTSELRELMMRLAAESAGFVVEGDMPLLDSGMDSKAAVEFSNRLTAELPTLRLPSTLVFDYPTLSAVAGYAAE